MPAKTKRNTRAAVGGKSVHTRARKPAAGSARKTPSGDERRRGRPTVYNAELVTRLCASIAQWVPLKTACRIEGIGRQTIYDWRRRAELGEQPYVDFAAQLDRALASVEASLLQHVQWGAMESWRAAAWLLERRFPKRYGTHQTLRVEKAPADMTDDELEAELARLGYQRTGPALDTLTELGEIIAADPPHTDR
jgi:hypothetical protein